VDKVIPNN